MSEVLRIQSIVDKCTSADNHTTDFVFIDEIFKGTNTVERISIADAVIRHLSSMENTVAVVSTHDIELARGLEGTLDTYHFNETIDSEQIRFSYTLIPGVVYTRNAISLLRLCGYPSSIINKAEENAKNIHFSNVIVPANGTVSSSRDGRLGMGLLKQFKKVIFNFEEMFVAFE